MMRACACLLAICGLVVGLGRSVRAEEYDLEVITPHHEGIQQEFERGFLESLGRPVSIRWIKKGTGEILQQLEAQDRAARGESFGLDVFFGGGVPDHDLAAARGYLEAPRSADEMIRGIPPAIAGAANFDVQKRWLGSALSSFGILVNKRGLASQGLPDVKGWEDLAHPRMYGWVVIADSRKSASVRVCYELVLQQYGWEKGWPMLMQMAANARTITVSSSAIPNEIATGNVLAGPCIDFYAYARTAEAGTDALSFINPPGGSAITPDPISMLRKPPHRELAEKFIAFVLSPAGQRLWVLPPGTPGGPRKHALFRLPVRPGIVSAAASGDTTASGVPGIRDPYEAAEAGVFRTLDDQMQRARSLLIAELMGAALVDQHNQARAAWKALIDGGMKPAALAEWNKLPLSESESLAAARKLDAGGREARRLTRDWSDWFRRKYEQVEILAR